MPIITKLILSFLPIIIAHTSYAQYPFERFPKVEYKEYKNWESDKEGTLENINFISYSKTIPHFFGKESLVIRAVTHIDSSNYTIHVLKGKKLIQKIPADISLIVHNKATPIMVADINGDGLLDVKIMMNGTGCGLAAEYSDVIYLFQCPGFKFTVVSYTDMMYDNRTERDIDGDGNYEIITKDLQYHQGHNYWVFNVYSYRRDSLINVNEALGYPIMVQYLHRQNYKASPFSKSVLQNYSSAFPKGLKIARAK